MNFSEKALLPLVLTFVMAGCAGNAVRLETAGRVSTAATATVNQADAALANARANRLAANAALIASDPSCTPGADVISIYVPNTSFSARRPPAPLCAAAVGDQGIRALAGYDVIDISVRPLEEDAIRPTVALIGAVADYQSALAKLLARPDADVGKELEGIMAKASTAKTLAEGLTGASLPKLPDLKSKQAKSALALINFVAKLAQEARKAEDLRRLIVQRGPAVMAIVPELKSQLTLWAEILQGTDLATQTNSLIRAYETEKMRPSSTFDQRLGLVQRINAARADETAVATKKAALGKVLDEFTAVHTELTGAFAGRYTPEAKQRIAELNEQRLLSALDLVAGVFTTWGIS